MVDVLRNSGVAYVFSKDLRAWLALNGGGGVAILNDLKDVDTATTAPTNTQVLTYNTTTNQWEPADAGGGAESLTDLSDVTAITGTTTVVVVGGAGTAGVVTAYNANGDLAATSPAFPPRFNDTSSDHQYVILVNELAADRNITLPLLLGNDVFVFADFIQTLTNKTLTSPTINTPAMSADSIDAITDIAAALKSGSDGTLITGTDPGVAETTAKFNSDGDVVGGVTPVEGSIILGNATPAHQNLAIGTADQILTADGTTAAWGAIPGVYFPPLPPLWTRINNTTGNISRGDARPTSGVQFFPGIYVVASFAADLEVYCAWRMPDKFPAGTLEMLLECVPVTEPGTGETLIVTLDHEEYAEDADLDAVTFVNEGTETITTGAGTDVFRLFQASHTFGTVPAVSTLMVCRLTFELASTFAVDSVVRPYLRWV